MPQLMIIKLRDRVKFFENESNNLRTKSAYWCKAALMNFWLFTSLIQHWHRHLLDSCCG